MERGQFKKNVTAKIILLHQGNTYYEFIIHYYMYRAKQILFYFPIHVYTLSINTYINTKNTTHSIKAEPNKYLLLQNESIWRVTEVRV